MSKTTPILLTTHTLSKAVDRLLEAAQANGGMPNKSAILTLLAGTIAGPKHDWGYLTGATHTIVAVGAERFAPTGAPTTADTPTLFFYQFDERDDWCRAPVGPFASRAAALHALAKDPWIAQDPQYPVGEVINALATQDEFIFYGSEDPRNEDGDAAPFSVSLFSTAPIKATPTPTGMPIVGYQIWDGEDYYEASDGNQPASFELFTTHQDAQAYLDRITPARPDLRIVAVQAGDIEHPSWI